jgi:transcription elongation factor GreA
MIGELSIVTFILPFNWLILNKEVKIMKAMYLSQEQHQRLHNELDKLKNEERPQIVAAIAEARSHGDLSENAEYDAAKEKQYLLERKIARLEETLSRARVLREDDVDSQRIHVGSKVTLVDIKTNEETRYELVPTAEFDSPSIDSISLDSPVGKALIGKEVGEMVEIKIPAGIVIYKVIKIA